jgi:hypothetical protein
MGYRVKQVEDVDVPEYVLEALEEVRASGLTNMLVSPTVLELISENDAYAAFNWLREHPEAYMSALRQMGERRAQQARS